MVAVGCRAIPKTAYFFAHCAIEMQFSDGSTQFAELTGCMHCYVHIDIEPDYHELDNGSLFSDFIEVASGDAIVNALWNEIEESQLFYQYTPTLYTPAPWDNSNHWVKSMLDGVGIDYSMVRWGDTNAAGGAPGLWP